MFGSVAKFWAFGKNAIQEKLGKIQEMNSICMYAQVINYGLILMDIGIRY